MKDQQKFTTEVTLKVTFEHFQTCSPKEVANLLKSMLGCPAVKSVEEVEKRKTVPNWPFWVGA